MDPHRGGHPDGGCLALRRLALPVDGDLSPDRLHRAGPAISAVFAYSDSLNNINFVCYCKFPCTIM
ncbi:protein of unknown function (plasmid) [Azospirillum lipoferum 4B]|uniref:Uncharacterized protein n=1 Tax=Azospirillum lipoferum (strain 4B) TaxID=862719 RepID=G7ZGG7_AZOL4|nr:protein of unknown function [Azospirillum lipoferum 4B]